MAAEILSDLSRATDANSAPLAGATWTFYLTGTSTLRSVYTSAALSVEHSNPVVADAGGLFDPIYFDASVKYRGVLKTAEGVTLQDIDPINTGVISQLAGDDGASLVGTIASGTGAVSRTVQDKLRESVSVFDFINPSYHADILDGSTTQDVSAAIASALDSGENIYFPGNAVSKYRVDGQIQISNDHQKVRGNGSRIELVGISPTENAIELLSTRRDLGGSTARWAQEFSGFRIIGPSTARYASLFFLEEGTFGARLADLYSEAGTGKGYFGGIEDAAIRLNGNAGSYVNDAMLERIFFHAIRGGDTSEYPPVGLWYEGAIECHAKMVRMFYFNECLRLGDPTGVGNRVFQCNFYDFQGEPTKPTDIEDNQSSVVIYQSSYCTFFGGKLDPGNGVGTANSRAVRFKQDATGTGYTNGLQFIGTSFQGFGNVDYAIEVEADAIVYDTRVSGGTMIDFAAGRVLDNSPGAQIAIDPSVSCTRVVPKRQKMQARAFSLTGFTNGSGAAVANAGRQISATDLYVKDGTPILVNTSVDQNFNIAEAYRVAAQGTWKAHFFQLTGANRAIASGSLLMRPFRDDEIDAQVSYTVDYASIISGSAATSDYSFPGAKVGRPYVATFYGGGANGLNGIFLEAYCSADNVVTVLRANTGADAVDLVSGTLTISQIKPQFDLAGLLAYNISGVTLGTRVGQSLAIPGVEPGDVIMAWYSHSQEGVIIRAYCSSAGIVRIELINLTTATPAGSASGQILIGVYKTPSVI